MLPLAYDFSSLVCSVFLASTRCSSLSHGSCSAFDDGGATGAGWTRLGRCEGSEANHSRGIHLDSIFWMTELLRGLTFLQVGKFGVVCPHVAFVFVHGFFQFGHIVMVVSVGLCSCAE